MDDAAPKRALSRFAKRDAMANFVADERRREPTVRYSELERRVRAKFKVSRGTAQRSITDGTSIIRDDFVKFAADAPRAIFDAYMDIHAEAMRERNWNAARRALDSVRDMFGIKTPVNVYVSNGAPPPSAFAALSDEQLDALARLDEAAPVGDRVIDLPTELGAAELAEAAMPEDESDDTASP